MRFRVSPSRWRARCATARSGSPPIRRARGISKLRCARHPVDTARLWPRLDTVSAWADGASRPYARRLAEMLPHACPAAEGVAGDRGRGDDAVLLVLAGPGADQRVPRIHRRRRRAASVRRAARGRKLSRRHDQRRAASIATISATGCAVTATPGCRRCWSSSAATSSSDLVGEKLCEAFVSEALGSLDGAACLAPRAAATPFYELLVEAGCSGNVATDGGAGRCSACAPIRNMPMRAASASSGRCACGSSTA